MSHYRKLRDRLFYDPYRAVAKNGYVRMGKSHLGPAFRMRFDKPQDQVALQIGNRCVLNNHFIFESNSGRITVGDGVFINQGTKVMSRCSIEIGNAVMIAWNCVIYDHDSHSPSYLDRIADQEQVLRELSHGGDSTNKDWANVAAAPIQIRDYAWLGFEVVILKGVTIGEGAIVGARAVVTRDVPEWTIAAGNPACVVKEIPPELRRQRPFRSAIV
jgi:acetyltransferase-like isoleucine patch superfamily enzyme